MQSGIYTCKVLTYEQANLPEVYHDSDLYDKICCASIVKLHVIEHTENFITVNSTFDQNEFDKFSQYLHNNYTKDTLSNAFVRSDNGLNYYVLPCSVYKLDEPTIVNSVVPIVFKISDLPMFGNTVCQSDFGTSFIVNGDSSNVETIFIRSIVESLGYKIISMSDFCWDPDNCHFDCDLEVNTTLPWKLYKEICGLRDIERDKMQSKSGK